MAALKVQDPANPNQYLSATPITRLAEYDANDEINSFRDLSQKYGTIYIYSSN
jgi:hypothetical protein